MSDDYPPQRAAFVREAIQHYCDSLQVSPREIAETMGVSGERMEQFLSGALSKLEPTERANLLPLLDEFVEAEDAMVRDYVSHPSGVLPRTTRAILAEHMRNE